MNSGEYMQYNTISTKKQSFIVTPDELRKLLKGFHHVVTNTGVKKGYTESDPDDFFSNYDELYQALKSGKILSWQKDYRIAGLTTGITMHPENCIYEPAKSLCVPHFIEPCPWIQTFCFHIYTDRLSTTYAVEQFPENICGLCLHFPAKVEYATANIKHSQGIAFNTDFDDFDAYETLLCEIKMITKPLILQIGDGIRRTTVRISEAAKKDICHFYFMEINGISVL